jgi:hypothetical protein
MSEYGGRLCNACRRFEDRVGLARDEISDRFGMIRIGRRWIHPHHVSGVGDNVTASAERLSQRFKLVARHEHVDIDRRAQPAVIAYCDASDHGMIGSDLGQDHGQLGEHPSTFLQGFERMIRDAESVHASV